MRKNETATTTVEAQARDLARANKKAEPAIQKIYWFPNKKEIRLVELEDNTVPALSGYVEPFYLGPSPQDDLDFPLAIAVIRTDEYRKLKLPRGWGSWSDAVELKVRP